MPNTTDLDVHTEHCCKRHGCKYANDRRCTVTSGQKTQSHPCETCLSPMVQLHDAIDGVLAADELLTLAMDKNTYNNFHTKTELATNLRIAIVRLRQAKAHL